MKADSVNMSDVLMAGVTINFGWVDDQACVSEFFIFQAAITTMADNTTYLAVGALDKIGILQEDFFPNLQRRYITASALAGGFPRRLLFLLRGYFFEGILVAMAGDAGACYRFSFSGGWGSRFFPGTSGGGNGNCY